MAEQKLGLLTNQVLLRRELAQLEQTLEKGNEAEIARHVLKLGTPASMRCIPHMSARKLMSMSSTLKNSWQRYKETQIFKIGCDTNFDGLTCLKLAGR